MNTTIEFCTFELVQILHFILNNYGFLDQICSKRAFPIEKWKQSKTRGEVQIPNFSLTLFRLGGISPLRFCVDNSKLTFDFLKFCSTHFLAISQTFRAQGRIGEGWGSVGYGLNFLLVSTFLSPNFKSLNGSNF